MSHDLPELWTCPKCGARLVSPNMSHSCGIFTVEALFARSEPQVYACFQRFAELVQSCGSATLIPQKTRAVFQVRTRFAGATPRKSMLICHFIFTQRHENPRFTKIEYFSPECYMHVIHIMRLEQMDAEFTAWIQEAMDNYGQQKRQRGK